MRRERGLIQEASDSVRTRGSESATSLSLYALVESPRSRSQRGPRRCVGGLSEGLDDPHRATERGQGYVRKLPPIDTWGCVKSRPLNVVIGGSKVARVASGEWGSVAATVGYA